MSVDWKRALLLYRPGDPQRFGFSPSDFVARGIPTLQVSYEHLGIDPLVRGEILASGCEALIFLANDDMEGHPRIGRVLRDLRLGYTAVSAIDRQECDSQTRTCVRDLLSGKADLPLPPPLKGKPHDSARSRGTCSLLFDLEQFGGARYGMPRLLTLLEHHGIRATFFVTGFIAEVFPSLLRRIVAGGHELGVHGNVHEFLQGRSLEDQMHRVKTQIDVLGEHGPVRGANFIFRMDDLTPQALVMSGVTYFVLFRKHLFHRTRFIPASSRARSFRTPCGDLTFVPVGVETYGLGWQEIRRAVDSAWETSDREGYRHVNVLMHPFKDGSARRIAVTDALLKYLIAEIGLRPIPLRELPQPQPRSAEAVQLRYRWDENEADPVESTVHHRVISWWRPATYHARRVESLVDALESAEVPTVLTATPEAGARKVYVYPDSGEKSVQVSTDTLVTPGKTADAVISAFQSTDAVIIAPPGPCRDLIRKMLFHAPRNPRDLATMLARIGRRLLRAVGRAEQNV